MGKLERWQKQFFILYIGQAFSILSSSILNMAIVWHITETYESAALLSVSTMINFLPQAILGIFIGVYIDRKNRQNIMMIADLFMAAAAMILVVSGALGDMPLWLIYLVLFVRSVANSFHLPALQATIPNIVPKEELTRYAGFAHSFKSFSFLISPALAAALYSVWELNWIIFLDVIGAILAIIFLKMAQIEESDHAKDSSDTDFMEEVKGGLRVIKQEPGLIQLLWICLMYSFIYFPIGTLFPLITMTWFQGGVTQSGIVEVLFSAGMLIGSLLLGVVGKHLDHLKAIITSIGIYGICCLLTGLLPPTGLRVFMAVSFVIGLINPFYHSVLTAIYQSRIDDRYLGRVLSVTGSIGIIAMPIGLILAGSFAELIGVNRWFAISGVLTLLIMITGVIILPKYFKPDKI